MTELDITIGSDSAHSEFEEVTGSTMDGNNFSDGEIIDSDWHYELETILKEDFVDQGMIKNVCKCRNVPDKFRPQVWKICLNVANRGNAMSSWDGSFDASSKEQMLTDCTNMVNSIIESGSGAIKDKEDAIQNSMAVFAFYCKCRAIKYSSGNGWTDILHPILELGFDRGDLYNCFYAMQSRFIPRKDLSSHVSAAPYHLLRLLLLYHDPELCNFLDTCKISTELFTIKWFSTLFSSHCSSSVVSAIWDVYLQQADSFFVFFLALVILVNAKEQVMENLGPALSREETLETLSNSPSVLSIDDVDDFCQLALYYCERTPSSFRRELGGCFYSGAMVSTSSKLDLIASDLAHSFCLKVSIPELLLSSHPSTDTDSVDESGPSVRFFVVDCRPAELYNQAHLMTAFHLDATLMLSEPSEFDSALKSLFAAQEQAMKAGSAAAGEHLCFVGSGSEEEDQYMHMVVANLLQKHQAYVSIARGGFTSLMEYLSDVGIELSEWIVGDKPSQPPSTEVPGSGSPDSKGPQKIDKLKKFAGNMFEKTKVLKEKFSRMMEESDDEWGGQSSAHKGHKGDSVFTIGDETEHSDDDTPGSPLAVKHDDIQLLTEWASKSEVKHCFQCQAVTKDARLVAAHLLITSDHMICLVEVKGRQRNSRKTWVRVKQRRLLCTVVKITSRRSFPELITFKFGDLPRMDDDEVKVVAADKYVIPDAKKVTLLIKERIMEADEKRKKKAGVEGEESPDPDTS